MSLESNAIEMLMVMCGNSGCTISDSGGKDSSVIKHIAMKAHEKYGLDINIRHNHTTVDAPETVYYVREQKKIFKKAGIPYEISMPKESMFSLIVKKGTPPTRLMRYCCLELKENTGFGEKLVTGVRKAESNSRKANQGLITFPKPKEELKEKIENNENFLTTGKGGVVVLNLDNGDTRQIVENCYRNHKTLINPLIEWTDDDLWRYIRQEKMYDDLNPLYHCGYCRVGCIGCPMANKQRWEQFRRYPRYKDYYINAFAQMLKAREKRGLVNREAWKTPQKVFKWWMEDDNCDGQLSIDEYGNITEDYS